MRKTLLLSFLGLLCCSCSRKAEPGRAGGARTGGSPSVSLRMTQTDPKNDYTKPYLTDEKVAKFIESMKEDRNPLEFIFREGGQVRGFGEMKGQLDEFNAFARRYGFTGYEDYAAVWSRIAAGQMVIWGEGMKKGVVEMTQKSIQNAQEALKRAGLDAETRKMYEQQIQDGQKSLADLNKPPEGVLNEADLALVRKYNAQIEEASKKYRKTPQQ